MDGGGRRRSLLGGPHVALLCGRAETEAAEAMAMAAVGKVETCVLVYYTRTRKPTHPFRPQLETQIGAKFYLKIFNSTKLSENQDIFISV